MAFLPNLPSSLVLQHRSADKINCSSLVQQSIKNTVVSPPPPSSSSLSIFSVSTQASPVKGVQVKEPPRGNGQDDEKSNFYVNLGLAVRTLREDLPQLFTKDLNYDIYRDDITLIDPLNTFAGIEKYKLVFWALRFHGRILFREIGLDVIRIWQPSENTILIRWNLRGVPRIPWEAKGQFQGTSRYKLDRSGKIYEHKVDNLAFNSPRTMKPAVSVLDLVAASTCPASPNPTYSSSWVEFYRAVKRTLDCSGSSVLQDGLFGCS